MTLLQSIVVKRKNKCQPQLKSVSRKLYRQSMKITVRDLQISMRYTFMILYMEEKHASIFMIIHCKTFDREVDRLGKKQERIILSKTIL